MLERPADADHEPSDADDRVVPLDDPRATEPPVDDDDRDPAVQLRLRRRGPAAEAADPEASQPPPAGSESEEVM
ncbi:MAG TPA: hypothetical protein VHF89_17240 [Solirubrobacteraceae bacterium]|nr:hypothetical protein [Solirubrobacteraceae bacterium]